MRKLLWVLVALLVLSIVQSSFAKPPAKGRANPRSGIFGTMEPLGEVPFPFGDEVPFPWASIEGTYYAESKEYDAYFSFEVAYEGNEPYLRVFHHESRNGKLFGEGGGFTQTDNRIVRAAMRSKSGLSYMVFIRAFNDVEVDGQRLREATVLTIRSFGTTQPRKDWHFLLRKVSTKPVYYRR